MALRVESQKNSVPQQRSSATPSASRNTLALQRLQRTFGNQALLRALAPHRLGEDRSDERANDVAAEPAVASPISQDFAGLVQRDEAPPSPPANAATPVSDPTAAPGAGTAPVAIINAESEAIVAVGAIISDIPMVDQVDIRQIRSGDRVRIDGDLVTVGG